MIVDEMVFHLGLFAFWILLLCWSLCDAHATWKCNMLTTDKPWSIGRMPALSCPSLAWGALI